MVRTLLREWAYARPYMDTAERVAGVAHFHDSYNRERPHWSLAGQPPISRTPVNNLDGKNSYRHPRLLKDPLRVVVPNDGLKCRVVARDRGDHDLILPPKAINEARAELARRLQVPDANLVGTKRRRLETRPAKLPKLYSWGDLTDEDSAGRWPRPGHYSRSLPDPDKLVGFDRNRHVMVTMAANIERATRPQLTELIQLLVERVTASGFAVDPESIEWTPPARPFFEPAAWLWRPRTDSNRRRRP